MCGHTRDELTDVLANTIYTNTLSVQVAHWCGSSLLVDTMTALSPAFRTMAAMTLALHGRVGVRLFDDDYVSHFGFFSH